MVLLIKQVQTNTSSHTKGSKEKKHKHKTDYIYTTVQRFEAN